MKCLKVMLSVPVLKTFLKKKFYSVADVPAIIFGITFPNVIGLGAGFDKNATYLNELECLGFGFVEIGTVTPLAQSGNDKPRLFRLPEDKAIINRMGFNNDGAEAVAARLQQWRKRSSKMIVGVNIGKNKITANEDAWKDYETCFLKLQPHADYVVVNVSSPNTPGLRDLQQTTSLEKILTNLLQHNKQMQKEKPVFLKLSPDIDTETLDEIIELCLRIQLHGLIIANTTISRDNLITEKKKIVNIDAGGLSGKPLSSVSTALVKYIHQKVNNKMVIIASGGIFTAKDVEEKMAAGAMLFQVWTGFIYEGPMIVKKILTNLTA